jgi:hypothetical protein
MSESGGLDFQFKPNIHSSFFAGKNKEKTLHYSAFFNVRSIAAF